MKFFGLVLFCFCINAIAAVKLIATAESKVNFTGDALFAKLDSVGGSGTWMEWDINGIKDPAVMEVLDPLLKSKNKPEMVWVLTEYRSPLLAVLAPKNFGEVLHFYELPQLEDSPLPLSINPLLKPSVVFRDYEQLSESEFRHLDKPSLKVSATEKRLRFTYEKADATPLRFDAQFKHKTQIEQKREVEDYLEFFKYEYVLMLRAFVQSTRGIFNWQPWHWYNPSWYKNYFISKEELHAIFMKGVRPNYFVIFKAKTKEGERVQFSITGDGFYELLVERP